LSKQYLNEKQVRARYGISVMTLWRWDRRPDLGFPPAFTIGQRKYRDEAELDAFDARQKQASLTAPKKPFPNKKRAEVADASSVA
jgi:hypothetical protein